MSTDLLVRAVGPATATTTVVLMHGFGAGGDDLVDLAHVLRPPPSVRFLFPAAPLVLDPDGDSRAWWMIDLARLERAMAAGVADDRSDEIPPGLAPARALISGLVDQLEAGGGKIVLGGFSQGAMLALDVALHRARPLAGLALMSGTRINGAAWQAGLAQVQGVPTLLSHGKGDPLLPFAVARTLRDQLAGAGADLDWIEFAGGHEIPPPVVAGLGRLVARVASGA